LALCNEKNFNYSNWTEASKVGVGQLMCMNKTKDFHLQGHFYTSNFSYLEIRLFKCVNNTDSGNKCAPQSEIDKYFYKKIFNVAFVNHFFDIKSFEPQPVQSFIDDSLFWHLENER
jgi:hypothetical protein